MAGNSVAVDGHAGRTRRQLIRYLVAGSVNTACTYLLLLLLMRVIDYRVAYTIVYAAGIAVAYVLYSRYVFEVPLHRHKALGFPLVYVVPWMLGVVMLWLLVDVAALPREIAALIVIVLNVPIGFLSSRKWLSTRRTKVADEASE